MLKKFLSVMLTCLLINVAASAVHASSQDDKDARRIEKIKEGVRKLGVGEAARVEVKLNDGREFKGYIREATEDSFVVVEEKTGIAVTVTYAQVSKLKGKNGLTAAKVGINVAKGVAVVAGVAAAFTLLMYLVIPKT
jgi:hypothetical protein